MFRDMGQPGCQPIRFQSVWGSFLWITSVQGFSDSPIWCNVVKTPFRELFQKHESKKGGPEASESSEHCGGTRLDQFPAGYL